jgi:hypothetical protein
VGCRAALAISVSSAVRARAVGSLPFPMHSCCRSRFRSELGAILCSTSCFGDRSRGGGRPGRDTRCAACQLLVYKQHSFNILDRRPLPLHTTSRVSSRNGARRTYSSFNKTELLFGHDSDSRAAALMKAREVESLSLVPASQCPRGPRRHSLPACAHTRWVSPRPDTCLH